MKFTGKILFLFFAPFLFWGCPHATEPETQQDYSNWLRYMVHTVYDRSTGQSIVSYQNEKSNFSTYGITGFTNESVRQLDGILLADQSPYHPWDSRSYGYSYPYRISKAIFRKGILSDLSYKVSFNEKKLGTDARAYYLGESGSEPPVQSGQWTIELAGAKIAETVSLPDTLMPVTLSSDTISISKGETIRWNNPVSGGFVVINFLNWGNDIMNFTTSYYTRTGIMIPDTGAYTFSKKDFQYSGIEPGDIISIKLIRGKFYAKEFPELNKKFGFLSTTTAAIQVRVKE